MHPCAATSHYVVHATAISIRASQNASNSSVQLQAFSIRTCLASPFDVSSHVWQLIPGAISAHRMVSASTCCWDCTFLINSQSITFASSALVLKRGIACAAMQSQKQPKATTRLICSSARRTVRAAAVSLHRERLCSPSIAVPLNPSFLPGQVHLLFPTPFLIESLNIVNVCPGHLAYMSHECLFNTKSVQLE